MTQDEWQRSVAGKLSAAGALSIQLATLFRAMPKVGSGTVVVTSSSGTFLMLDTV